MGGWGGGGGGGGGAGATPLSTELSVGGGVGRGGGQVRHRSPRNSGFKLCLLKVNVFRTLLIISCPPFLLVVCLV